MKKIIGFIITILAMCSFAFCNIESKEVVYASGEEEAVFNTPECYQQAKGLWSSFVIGGSSIATSGCGLLSLTNAVNYLTGNFIEPTNLAKYAYAIDAYNGSIGGGTARWVLYNQLQAYEKKYGFKVTSAGRDGTITRPDVKAHLKKGGTVIAHVYGHFIAIVGYNEVNNTYCVYDCAANASKRYSYPYGTWLSEDILKNSQYMSVDWYCLLERATNSIVKLDQEGGTYKNSKALKENGANVLGITETPTDYLPYELKVNLTDHYKVDSLHNFDQKCDAIRYFINKYGPIDYIESNNEYWLDDDARLREIFNVTTGPNPELIKTFNRKSLMKEGYKRANVKTARYLLVSTIDKAKDFINVVGYPVVVKPDHGVGASKTYKISDAAGLVTFFEHYDE